MTAENDNTPEGVKEFLLQNKIPEGRPWVSYLYRRKKALNETKVRNYYLEKYENGFYEGEFGEDYIKSKYGGGRYQVIIKWRTEKNESGGIELNDIYIEGPQLDDSVQESARQTVPPSDSAGSSNKKVESIEEKLERWIPLATSLAALIKEIMPKPDTTILDKMQEQYLRKIGKVDDEILNLKKEKLSRLAEKELEEMESEEEVMGEAEIDSIYPAWLKPFAPLIEKFGGQLLKNNPVANMLKSTVVKSGAFQENWGDPDKRAEAVEAISKHLGPEMAHALEETFNQYMGENH